MRAQNIAIAPVAAGVIALALIIALLAVGAAPPFAMPAIDGARRDLTTALGWEGFFNQLLYFRFTL